MFMQSDKQSDMLRTGAVLAACNVASNVDSHIQFLHPLGQMYPDRSAQAF